MSYFQRLYYHLTAYVPRMLPRTPEEYERLKRVLIEAYDVPNEPQIWALVSGQITSSPPHRLRAPWGNIANAAKKLRVMNLAMGHKHAALSELNDRLEAAVKAESERLQQEDADAQKAAQELAQAHALPEPQACEAPSEKDVVH